MELTGEGIGEGDEVSLVAARKRERARVALNNLHIGPAALLTMNNGVGIEEEPVSHVEILRCTQTLPKELHTEVQGCGALRRVDQPLVIPNR
eukprot:272187-Prorocentrum_minimum.AAC.3